MKTFMKTALLALFAIIITGTVFAQAESLMLHDELSNNEQTTIKVAKITTTSQCEMCKARIEKAVNKLSGIKSAVLDVPTKVLTVKYDENDLTLEKIRKTVSKTGYDADSVKADPKAYKMLPPCCKVGGHK